MIREFYNQKILPKLLDRSMKSESFEQCRKDVVENVSGTVLEIGFGSGLNLDYYRNVKKLFALEPYNELFELTNLESVGFPIEHLNSGAENMPLPDNSIDYVVSTWVFCSIPDPDQALQEIKRVLKPNGIFSFVEHGISDDNFKIWLQNKLTPIWKLVAGGCHLNRDIEEMLLKNGFEITSMKKFQVPNKPLLYMYKGRVKIS